MDINKRKVLFEHAMKDFFGERLLNQKSPAGQYMNGEVYSAFIAFCYGIDAIKIKVPKTSIRWRDANTAKMEDILNAEIEMRNIFIDAVRNAGIEPVFGDGLED